MSSYSLTSSLDKNILGERFGALIFQDELSSIQFVIYDFQNENFLSVFSERQGTKL